MKPFIHSLKIVLLLPFLISCATQNLHVGGTPKNSRAVDTVFNFNPDYAYTLKKDDKISISVWDNDDLSVGSVYGIYNSNEVYGKWLMLDGAGNVNVPKIGTVHLSGLTTIEARKKLAEAFRKWIVNPIVDVKILNREVTVLGEFKTPGKYLLEKEDTRLVEIMGKAGDMDFYANKRKLQLIRTIDNHPHVYNLDLTRADPALIANIQVRPGDILYVPSRKGKTWDRRAGSTIVPIVSAISAAVLIKGFVK